MIIAILAAVCSAAAIVYALRWRIEEELPQKPTAVRRIAIRKRQAPEKKPEEKKTEEKEESTTPPFINGTVTDTEGNPMAGVVVSNGIDCAAGTLRILHRAGRLRGARTLCQRPHRTFLQAHHQRRDTIQFHAEEAGGRSGEILQDDCAGRPTGD